MYFVAKNNRDSCTGCTACQHVCPRKCIHMNYDVEGFLYPEVDANRCNNCNLCFYVCPENVQNMESRHQLPNICYAAMHKDDSILMDSSSGGAFSGIVQCFDKETHIFGARYDEELNVIHCGISGDESYDKLMKSKYVQSNLKDTYIHIKEHLLNGTEVVFSGTPCQIAGLKSFVKNKGNLFCVELLCHGVASPGVFSEYKDNLEKKYKSKLTKFIFRKKDAQKGMWKDYLTELEFSNGRNIKSKSDLYTLGFLQSLFNRKCCIRCQYACENRVGDIVIGDFWKLEENHPELVSRKGVSLIIPITEKGFEIIHRLVDYMMLYKLSINEAIKGNSVLLYPTAENKNRNDFFIEFGRKPIINILSKYIKRKSYTSIILKRILPTNIIKTLIKFKYKFGVVFEK